ncbi:MAG: nucleoside recognition domain-containing protein [Clostridium sp.]|nr:nucleoside recognition domain-containing protein [Clostridium sp.]
MKSKWQQALMQRKTVEGVIFIIVFFTVFSYIGGRMGLSNMLNTIMNTAHDLLLQTVFYLMGVVVLSGALSKLFTEFGVVRILQFLFGPLMRPLFRLPGVAVLGSIMAFLSDNPAVLTLAQDQHYNKYFRKYELLSFVNYGTAFGMGLIVFMFMLGKGYAVEPFIGLVGAMIGCILSTRLFQYLLLKKDPGYNEMMPQPEEERPAGSHEEKRTQMIQAKESIFIRFLNALLDGGKSGVELGLAIIPGVIIISTAVFLLTFGPGADGVYDGSAYQGIQLLPRMAGKINFIFDWLFGFKNAELVAFPITSLGAVGAALGQVPRFIAEGLLDGNAVAVFTAMGISWSGFFSTYSAIFDAIGYRQLTSQAITVHLLCGLLAGIFAHLLYLLYSGLVC